MDTYDWICAHFQGILRLHHLQACQPPGEGHPVAHNNSCSPLLASTAQTDFFCRYGAYEICNDPYMNANRLSLIDRGFVFALAHVRGGGEMGRSWYEDGKYLSKKNTFTDFIACAEYLVKEKWTSPAHMCIEVSPCSACCWCTWHMSEFPSNIWPCQYTRLPRRMLRYLKFDRQPVW